MNLKAVLRAQSVRLMDLRQIVSNIYAPDLLERLREKYGFVQTPKLEELNPAAGITFGHGRFSSADLTQQQTLIRTFQVYNTGLIADVSTSSEDGDLFLDDLIRWVIDHDKAQAPPVTRRFYWSQLEV